MIDAWAFAASMGLMAAAMVAQAALHSRERKDLYDRIMSRDLPEYKRAADGAPAQPRISAHKRAIANWRDPHGGA